jgi:peptide/nickel transport system permease protein
MARFLLGKLGQGAIVVLGVTAIVFLVTRLIGDPVAQMLPVDSTPEQRADLRALLGLDRPIVEQFGNFLLGLARLDFGESLWQRRPAIDIVLEGLPATLALAGVAMAAALLFALPLGIIAALRPGRLADVLATTGSLIGASVPQFWLGLLLILLFSVLLGLLPTSGAETPLAIVLPAATLALPAMGRLAMMVRSTMIDELNAPHIRTAIAKGLPRRRIVLVHAMRNGAIPILSLAGWEFVRTLAGYTVIVETVFAWPGIGLAAVQAIQRDDMVLLQAVVLVTALLVVAVNLALDVLFRLIDPRVKA